MIEVGRLCVKIAGRDAGKKCVIIDTINDSFVMIDGETRRRKCNVKHIEPLPETIKLAKNAAHTAVVSEFKKLGIEIKETKPRKAQPKVVKMRAADRKKQAPAAAAQKTEKKAAAKPKDNKLEKALE